MTRRRDVLVVLNVAQAIWGLAIAGGDLVAHEWSWAVCEAALSALLIFAAWILSRIQVRR